MNIVRSYLLAAFITITAFVSFIPLLTYVYFASSLASKESLVSHNDTGLILFDYKGRPFFSFYNAKTKQEIPLTDIPLNTQQAIIASEDKSFYSHPGFSIPAIIRSFFDDIRGKSLAYGGSTITQQLVKNSLLYSKKDFLRKYQEIVLASEIERRYSKGQILEMYLNSVYFGEGAFGIEEAAKTYFDKSAKDLTLAESAILSGLLPAPSRLSLLNGNLVEAKSRQKTVLEKMAAQGFITPTEGQSTLREKLEIASNSPPDINRLAPHFALMVRDQLIKKYGEEAVVRSGFKVKTSLDLDWQEYAEKVVAEQVNKLKVNNVSNGAVVVLDPKTSEIRVMVGSANWHNNSFGKVNMATSPRSPGSAFKPIVYIRAFEEGLITPATILHDQPTRFANFEEDKFFASFPTRAAALANLSGDPSAYYSPRNYDGRFRGLVTVRRALSNSLNVPSVEVMKKVGVGSTLDSARNLGITTLKDPSNYGLSLVLGAGEVPPLEMANAYAVFANNGFRNEPTAVLEITDKTGKTIYKYEPDPQKVVDERNTFLLSSILSDNKTRTETFGTALNISRPAAVKTGTAENFKDSWTIGYTPSLVVGVWVGNNYNQPMDGIAGSLGAAPIWKSLMERFLAGTPVEQFTPPDGIIKVSSNCTFDLSTKIASYSGIPEYFAEGTEPPQKCSTSIPPTIPPRRLPR